MAERDRGRHSGYPAVIPPGGTLLEEPATSEYPRPHAKISGAGKGALVITLSPLRAHTGKKFNKEGRGVRGVASGFWHLTLQQVHYKPVYGEIS
jgi:hypothetical protein